MLNIRQPLLLDCPQFVLTSFVRESASFPDVSRVRRSSVLVPPPSVRMCVLE
jgi:hypothetical protein